MVRGEHYFLNDFYNTQARTRPSVYMCVYVLEVERFSRQYIRECVCVRLIPFNIVIWHEFIIVAQRDIRVFVRLCVHISALNITSS